MGAGVESARWGIGQGRKEQAKGKLGQERGLDGRCRFKEEKVGRNKETVSRME